MFENLSIKTVAKFIRLRFIKTVQELNNRKVPIVRIDQSLEKYRNKVLFLRKLKKVNKMLKAVKLPNRK